MDRLAMPDEVRLRPHAVAQRRVDLVEMDVRDESVDGGIDAARLRTEHEAARRDQTSQPLLASLMPTSAPVTPPRTVRPAARSSRTSSLASAAPAARHPS